jgi:hypothetical protein
MTSDPLGFMHDGVCGREDSQLLSASVEIDGVGKYLSGKRLENICLKSDENTMQFYNKPPIEDKKNRSESPVEDIRKIKYINR